MTIAASMFCPAVSVGTRLNCWKMNPIVSRRSRDSSRSDARPRSTPSSCTLPPVGRSSAPSSCSSVVLPDPLCPMITVNSPRWMLSVTSASAVTAAAPDPYTRLTPSSR